jgi:hypothetical protein
MPPFTTTQELDEVSASSFCIDGDDTSVCDRAVGSSVYFKEDANVVYEIERFDNPDVWYTKAEYQIIRLRDSLIVELMKASCFRETDQHTFRGLEQRDKVRGWNAITAVLVEQDRQDLAVQNFSQQSIFWHLIVPRRKHESWGSETKKR